MKKLLIRTLIISLFLSSCTDEIMNDIDTNPNQFNNAPLRTLLPQVEMSLLSELVGNTGISVYFVTEQNTFVLGGNALESGEFAGSAWSSAYSALNDLSIIKQKGLDNEAWTYVGIADVLRAYNLSVLTDLFGEIPYTEALKPDIINPAFDTSESIYQELQVILDAAIVNLQKEPGILAPGRDDLFFDGDQAMWIKTAYGLKARLYNRLSNLDPQGSANNALGAIALSFANQDENLAFTEYDDTNQNGNPFVRRQIIQPQSSMGNGMFNTMTSFSPTNNVEDDPRADIWFSRIDGEIVPAPNGTAEPDFGEPRLDGALYSKPEIFKVLDAPQPLLTFVELKFIEAEARLRLNQTAEANAAYELAVSLALEQASDFNPEVALSPEQINDYLALPEVFPGASALTLQDIISQKYIYFYQYQPIETYNDIRRTGLLPVTDPTGRPNRSVYPNSEQDRNTNTPLVIDQFSVFEPSTKLFWAK